MPAGPRVTASGSTAGGEGDSLGKMGGDHLECNPCGKVAGCELCHQWPGPEVLLSLLPNQGGIVLAACACSICAINSTLRAFSCW